MPHTRSAPTPTRWIVLLALLAGMAPWPAAHAAWVTKMLGSKTIHIIGELKLGDEKDFAALLDDKVTQVFINTAVRGNEASAMEIGRLVRQRRLGLHVRKLCLGVCAQYIFTAGTRNTIAEGAVVGLHAGVIPVMKLTVADLQASSPLSDAEAQWTHWLLAKYSGILRGQGGRKAAFERDMGLDAALIERIEAVTTPRHINLTEVTDKGFALTGKKGLCDVWVPDREGWRQLGVQVAPFVRPDAATVARTLKIDASRVSVLNDPQAQPDALWCENQAAPVEVNLRWNITEERLGDPLMPPQEDR